MKSQYLDKFIFHDFAMCVLFFNIFDVGILVLCKNSSIKDVHGTIDDIGFSFLLGFIKLIG
jgi:hypothetical protein